MICLLNHQFKHLSMLIWVYLYSSELIGVHHHFNRWIQWRSPESSTGQHHRLRTRCSHSLGLWISIVTLSLDSPTMHVHRFTSPWRTLGSTGACFRKTYRSNYAECRRDDSLHTQSQRQSTLHSYTSNCSNAQRSRSVLPIIDFTLISYDTHLSLIIFKIIPHPMTLLTAIPLQVIILHFI
jgi:hypothetical protein